MAGRDPLSPNPFREEPSNAELARLIADLKQQLATDRRDEEAFHNQLLGRIDGMNQAHAALQRQVDVEHAKSEAAITAITTRQDTHDAYHQSAEKSEKEKSDSRAQNLALLMGVVTIIATVAGALLGRI